MLTNTRLIRVQWGDCDPAGIVFYPRYFEWFDAGTILLFEKATGLTKIEAGAKFVVPSQYGDDIEIETSVKEFGRSSFSMLHKVSKGGAPALEGHEKRVWTVRDSNDRNRLRSAPIPPEVLAGFNRP